MTVIKGMLHRASEYAEMIRRFVDTGEIAELGDPLSDYLADTMSDPFIKLQALSNDVLGQVFYDCMMRFVTLNINRSKMAYMRCRAELGDCSQAADWTDARKRDGWQGLVNMIKRKNPDAFDADFYTKQIMDSPDQTPSEELWNHMIQDWNDAIQRKLQQSSLEHMADDMAHARKITTQNLKAIPEYLEREGIQPAEFMEGWNMMEGVWNEKLFADIMKTVRLQRRYPVLEVIARRMGRQPDDNGTDSVSIGYGGNVAIAHSNRSDIIGITSGRNISDALPLEIAMCGDSDLEGIFMRKYVTNRLQVFNGRSEILSTSRRVHTVKARRKGPMIICLDTSSSMQGQPMRVAKALLLKLLLIAEREHRPCYLILFSVSIDTYDLVKDKIQVIENIERYHSGGTDSSRMMEETHRILTSESDYAFGDVLWVSDFQIPTPPHRLLAEMQEHQQAGTCFYGLQIGSSPQQWQQYFTEFYSEGYMPPRKY